MSSSSALPAPCLCQYLNCLLVLEITYKLLHICYDLAFVCLEREDKGIVFGLLGVAWCARYCLWYLDVTLQRQTPLHHPEHCWICLIQVDPE
jgi:hypothetical protein